MLASPCSFGPNRGSCVQSTAPTSILPGPTQFFFYGEIFDIRNHIVFFRLPSQALRASLQFMKRLGLVDVFRRPSESGGLLFSCQEVINRRSVKLHVHLPQFVLTS
jgi:hypothetical protein